MISQHSQELTQSTNCHTTLLIKNDQYYHGVYNGLSNWARIEDSQGVLIETLWLDPDLDGYQPPFYPNCFESFGYSVCHDGPI